MFLCLLVGEFLVSRTKKKVLKPGGTEVHGEMTGIQTEIDCRPI